MYTKVFPLLDEFQKENVIEHPFDNFAKCYGVCDKTGREAIIVQNLKAEGFEIHCRTQPQNLNHVLFIFRNYGRFHALSLAMKIKKPSIFKALTKNMTDVMGMFIIQANMLVQLEKDFDNALRIFQKYNDSAIAKKFENIRSSIKEVVSNLGKNTNPASVILHGDCWNNNMMFKYEVIIYFAILHHQHFVLSCVWQYFVSNNVIAYRTSFYFALLSANIYITNVMSVYTF